MEKLGSMPVMVSQSDNLSLLVFNVDKGTVWRCAWITAEGDTMEFAGAGTRVGNDANTSMLFKVLVDLPPDASKFIIKKIWVDSLYFNTED